MAASNRSPTFSRARSWRGWRLAFSALAACVASTTDVAWSVGLVRLVVDVGLMLLVLAGVAAGRPFTLAMARAKVTPERAASPAFLRTASLIACAWAAAFGVLALADVVYLLRPDWPLAVPIALGVAGLLATARAGGCR